MHLGFCSSVVMLLLSWKRQVICSELDIAVHQRSGILDRQVTEVMHAVQLVILMCYDLVLACWSLLSASFFACAAALQCLLICC